MGQVEWADEPPAGTRICLGYDGSDVDDWSALRAETFDGYQFTPRFGLERLPTVWIPKELPGGRVSHEQVGGAIAEAFDRYDVQRFYYDPPRWETDGEQWTLRHGGGDEKRVAEWATYRSKFMFDALERFRDDLVLGRIPHDGCPLTARCMGNARMITKGQTYKLAKPNDHQKIDVAIASVLAHEAAADARATGWTDEPTDNRVFCFT